MSDATQNAGFSPPARNGRRVAAIAEFVTTLGLALATIVTATVIATGAARADVVDGVIGNETGLFAIALLLGLGFIGMGGLTLPGKPKKR
jgi:hypothetical protein